MLNPGPFQVGIIDDSNNAGAELNLGFTDELSAPPRNRQGILMLQQMDEQKLSHVETGEMQLHESIVIQLQMASP